MVDRGEGEKVHFKTGEHIVLPEDLSGKDLARALKYRQFIDGRIQGRSTEPTVAERPSWVSKLTPQEGEALERARRFVIEVEKNPDHFFQR